LRGNCSTAGAAAARLPTRTAQSHRSIWCNALLQIDHHRLFTESIARRGRTGKLGVASLQTATPTLAVMGVDYLSVIQAASKSKIGCL